MLVENIANEFRLIFSSMTVRSMKLGRGMAKQLVQNHTEAFYALLIRY